MTPFVSIIIPVFDDYERLRTCLEALAGQAYPTDRFEVLVVDNGTPAKRRKTRQIGNLQLLYLDEPRGGSYAARNHGIEHASGEVIAFTDADCIPRSDWLRRGATAIGESRSIGLVAGRIDVFAQDPYAPTTTELYELEKGFPQRWYVEAKSFGATANVFTRTDVLDDIGGFNQDMHSAGDKEWGQRVAHGGYDVVYRDDVVVQHPARRTVSELTRKMSRVARGLHDLDFHQSESTGHKILALAKIARNTLPPVRFIFRTAVSNDWSTRQKSRLIAVHLLYVYGMSSSRMRLLLADLLRRG